MNAFHIAGSSNGRTSAFGAEYPGSNPGPAATLYELARLPRGFAARH